jgi:Ribosomal protein S1
LSLGIKPFPENPWATLNDYFKIPGKFSGWVIGVVVSHVHLFLGHPFDGIISLNGLSWLPHPPHPSRIVDISDGLGVLVLDIDADPRWVDCSFPPVPAIPWV